MTPKRQKLQQRRKAVGFTQESFAEKLEVERSTVVRWECGTNEPSPWIRPKMARALGISLYQLSELIEDFEAADIGAVLEPHDVGGYDSRVVDDVNRRNMLKALGVSAVTMAAMNGSGNKMLSPVNGRTGRVGRVEAESLFAHTARLRRLDNFLGGADTYHLYFSELEKTTKFLRDASCTSEVRDSLTCVVAEQAQLAGWAAFDAGMYAESHRHYMTSLTAARDAKNSALAGNSLAFLAYQHIATDKPRVDLATASYATAEREATPRVRALLLERMAWTHAVAGQPKETEAALEKAAEAFSVDGGQTEPDWVFWVDRNEIEIMAGRCWTVLRRPLRAVPTLESVLKRYDDTYARDKSMYLTWLAHAYMDAGEIEQGAAVTGRAIQLASGIASVRPLRQIETVVDRLKPHHSLPAVADIIDQARR